MNPETKTDTFLFSEQAQYGFATCCEEWLCLSVEFIPYLDCASTADEYLRLLVEIVPQDISSTRSEPKSDRSGFTEGCSHSLHQAAKPNRTLNDCLLLGCA